MGFTLIENSYVGFDYFQVLKRDQIIFYFHFTPIETKFKFPESDFSFKDLLDLSKENYNDNDFSLFFQTYNSSYSPLPARLI